MNACTALREHTPVERTSQRIDVGGHVWHVDHVRCVPSDSGRQGVAPQRATCLILHGTGASSDSVASLADALAARFDVVAPDLPAHARTRTPHATALDIDAQALALAALLDALDLDPELVIGHSAGAVVLAAWLLARSRRTTGRSVIDGTPRPQSLVAINGAMLPLEGPAGLLFEPLARLSSRVSWLPRIVSLRAEREPDNVRRLLESTGSRIDATMVARYRPLLSDPEHTSGVLRMMASWQLGRFAPRLAQLRTHVHLIAGDRDRTIPLRQAHRLARLLPDAHLDVVPNLGHLAHEEAPARIADLILRHVDERRSHAMPPTRGMDNPARENSP